MGPAELSKLVEVDSYWNTTKSRTDAVIKAEKKAPKKPAAAGKGVKVGGKKGKKGPANKDPKTLKAQQAAKKLLANKKVRVSSLLCAWFGLLFVHTQAQPLQASTGAQLAALTRCAVPACRSSRARAPRRSLRR